jgi:phosphoribosylformylglycinamidine synthase
MKSVREFAQKGRPVLGICNGFQILCEAGLLPGALLRNDSLKFKDQWVNLKVNQTKTAFSKGVKSNQVIRLPIAHGEGKFYADGDSLKQIADREQIWLTYEENPNGSALDIAGITNETKNVCGLMPHPERALTGWMGSTDGMYFL